MSAINSHSLQVGVLREQRPGERRVAMVPHDIRRLSVKAVVLAEREAGRDAGFPDDAYVEAGARVTSRDDVIAGSELLVTIRPPEAPQTLRPGSILISLGGRDQLFEMEQINPYFGEADLALVIGANDVTNPAARKDRSSPLYGMPILEVDRAKSVIVLKRSMRPGFAGVDNELYYNEKCMMLFGDARDSLTKLFTALK